MITVERLQAAIAKLEAQAHESSDGPWQAHIERGDYTISAELFDANGGYVISDGYVVDVELMEVLYRTIEPQIAILRLGIRFGSISPNAYTDAAVDLADAILGRP